MLKSPSRSGLRKRPGAEIVGVPPSPDRFRSRAGVVLVAAFVLVSNGAVFAQTIDENLWVTNGAVTAVVLDGGTVYIGGTFTQVGPATGGGVPLDAGGGVLPPSFPKVTGSVSAVVSDGAGGWFIGGSFTAVGGFPRSGLAHVASDLSVSTWNPNANFAVNALAVSGSTVYAGGEFSSIGGQPRNRIAALDVTTGAATAWSPDANAWVFALAVSGSTVYAGGNFTSIGGQLRNRIAALDATTGAATAWNPNANSGGSASAVNALAVSGSTVYAGGGFENIGGQARKNIAAIGVSTVDVPTGSSGRPLALRLENLPNPFRTSTRITFVLPSEASVTLEVIDIVGRVVATLLRDERAPAGFNQVEFRHLGLPSGLYLSRLQAGQNFLTRKMLLLH